MRVGRKLLGESDTAELRKTLRAWKKRPKDQRKPPTLAAYAQQLGISRQFASYLLKLKKAEAPKALRVQRDPVEAERLLAKAEALLAPVGPVPEPPRSEVSVKAQEPLPEPMIEGHGWNCECAGCRMEKVMRAARKLGASSSD